jgi:hypothetical protein
MVGGIRWAGLVLMLLLLILPSQAIIGYDITAQVGPIGYALHRATENLDFSIDGSVIGNGNFSRLTHINELSGVEADEKSSSTKNSDLNYSEKLGFQSREGPVYVTLNLQSNNITDTTSQSNPRYVFSEFADISVDEHWPAIFANLKRISYYGPGIRTSERYVNNGDVVSSYIDSWKLNKTSYYRTYINRTVIDVNVTPSGVFLDKSQNKSSSYILGMQSTGSLTHIDAVQRGSTALKYGRGNDIINGISEDYKGQQRLNLKIGMNGYITKQPTETIDWLPCCDIQGNYEIQPAEQPYLPYVKLFQ